MPGTGSGQAQSRCQACGGSSAPGETLAVRDPCPGHSLTPALFLRTWHLGRAGMFLSVAALNTLGQK